MKILTIRGKNLASLEGEFQMDFTVEPLKSAGIYAITGSTGSGKSTLLDALCLSLFDDTPRTNQVGENIPVPDVKDKTINQKDSRAILRRGTGDGYAETEFISLGGEHYRSTWLVKRSRGKADGSLQNSEMRLMNLSANVEVPGRKTELLIKITELIGFSFEQFTRAVLLAQGDFATFLKAKQSEKAELLEKLTGTHIYSRISVNIFNKSKRAEQELALLEERVRGIEVLPEDQPELLAEEKRITDKETESLKRNLETISGKLEWVKQDMSLRRELAEAQKSVADSLKRIEEAKPRYDYIARIESVQEIRDSFNELRQSQKHLAENESNLQKSEEGRKENALLLEQAKQKLLACEKEQKELEDLFAKAEPEIIKAREADVQIKAVEANRVEAKKETAAAEQSKKNREKTLLALQNETELSQKTIDELNQWFEKNKTFAGIVPRIELIINLLDDAQTAGKQSENNLRILEKLKALVEEDQKKSDELRREAERLNNLLPAEIAALRAKLQEGVPCIVCGSTHHPLQGDNEESRLNEEELNRTKQANEKKMVDLTKVVEERKNEVTRLKALTESYIKQSGDALTKADEHLSQWPSWKELFRQGTLQTRLKQQAETWNKSEKSLTEVQGNLTHLETRRLHEQKNLEEAAQAFEVKKEKLKGIETTLIELSEDRNKLLNGKSADETIGYYTEKRRDLIERLKSADENKNKYVAVEETYNGRIGQIKSEITRLKNQIEGIQLAIDRWIAAKQDITYEQVSELLSEDTGRLVSEKRKLNELREEETTAKATLAERKKNFDRHLQAEIKPQDETESQEFLEAERTGKNLLLEQKTIRSKEIELLLSAHAKGMEKIKTFEKELAEKRELSANWKRLNEMFGSADGMKFKKAAQSYTLDALLIYANKHLQQLSNRYLLQRIPDTLALQVVDLDMLNEVRTVHSLSGGESFLVSLALALGLSSLSSNQMKVESLFIDEGFGSLDKETLRIAMDALERLQNQGRKIGVISHVPEMTERINTQVRVIKSVNGRSGIEIVSF